MLAITEKINKTGPNTIKNTMIKKALVRLRFMNSVNKIIDRGVIRRATRNTIRDSRWLSDI